MKKGSAGDPGNAQRGLRTGGVHLRTAKKAWRRGLGPAPGPRTQDAGPDNRRSNYYENLSRHALKRGGGYISSNYYGPEGKIDRCACLRGVSSNFVLIYVENFDYYYEKYRSELWIFV